MNDEIWKPVVGYEGLYEISESSTIRKLTYGSNNGLPKDGIMKGRKHRSGYFFQYLTDRDGNQRTYKVHILTTRAFLGECPEGMEINHKDGDKLNNHISNLEYVTKSENIKHAFRLGLRKPTSGTLHGMVKLTDEMVLEIRERAANGESSRALATEYRISYSQIKRIINRERWKHI